MIKKYSIILLFICCSLNSTEQVILVNTGIVRISSTSDTLFINGNFTNNSSADISNNGNVYVKGDIINNQPTAITGNGTLFLNGTANQNISSVSAFNNLTLNKPTGKVILLTNLTVDGILNFISGNIQTGNQFLTQPSSGTVIGASQNTGWVSGKLQKYIITGSTTKIFETGDSLSYIPVSVAFSSVTVAGNLTAFTTATDHPNIASSGINPSKNVNRYWSLVNSGIIFTNANVKVNWMASDVDPGAATANFRVKSYNGSAWKIYAEALPTATSIQASGVTSFNDLAVGEYGVPNLGTVGNFTLFTTNGAVGNTGFSQITGNIGTNVGAITGFGTSNVIGTMQVADAVTAQCSIDLQEAYNQLSNTPATSTSHAPSFGTGETLNAGVYYVGSAGSVAGSLTLDGQGNPAAVFIFKFNGAFSTGAATTVSLVNGATACNVFWVAEGAVAMGASTIMKGTLISNNGAISMAAGGNLEGRMFSTTGAVAVDAVAAYLPLCYSGSTSWTGALSTDWNTNANWTQAIPIFTSNITIPSGLTNYPILNTGIATVNDITIQSGATISISTAKLQIIGNINNSGSINAINGTIELGGRLPQSISGSMFTGRTIQNLTISNVAVNVSSTANDSLIITGALAFGNINNSTITSGGNITLRSNTSGTARVADITNAGLNTGNNISGNVIVERFIPANPTRAWRLLAATTSGQTFKQAWQENQTAGATTPAGYGVQLTSSSPTWAADGFDLHSNGNGLLTYVGATGSYAGVSSTTNPIATTSGYMLYIRGGRTALPSNSTITATTLRTSGSLYQGNITPITVPVNQYAIIGNPYASQVDLTLLTRGADIDDIYYVWDPLLTGNFGVGAFQTFTSNGGGSYTITPGGGSYASGPYRTIESGQAFFVHSSGSSTNTISFTEAAKTSANRMVFGPTIIGEQLATKLYSMSGTTRNLTDGTLNLYDNTYSNTVNNEDAFKLGNFGLNLGMMRESKKLVVEKRQIIGSTDTIFFNLTNVAQQQYQFEFNAIALNQPGLFGRLVDSYLGTSIPVNLDGTTTVDFTVNADVASSAATRFMVVFYTAAPLPVTFTSLRAYQQGGNVDVEWKVTSQMNIRKYEVGRSTGGTNFITAGTLPATGNNGNDVTYNWLDLNPVIGNNFYRVRSIGTSGVIKYSTIVNVKIGNGSPLITIYPNPVINKTIAVQFTDLNNGIYQLRLINSIGQVVFTQQLAHTGASETQTVGLGNVPGGNYRLEIIKPDNTRMVRALIIAN